MIDKINLESDLKDLLIKYKDKLPSSDVVESIVGFLTCVCCNASKDKNDLKSVKTFIYKVVDKNIKECRNHFSMHGDK